MVEGSGVIRYPELRALPISRLLHVTLLRNAVQRGIYHFISCSLLRTQRHRVYMAMYGGLGLALLISCAVLLKPSMIVSASRYQQMVCALLSPSRLSGPLPDCGTHSCPCG